MNNFIVLALTLCYVFMTAFLEDTDGGRFVIPDLILIVLIILFIMRAVFGRKITIPITYLAALPLLLVFILGSLTAFYIDRAFFELVIVLFSFLGSLAIVNLLISMPEVWFIRFVKGYFLVIGFLATISLVDFFFMPGLISSRQLGGLQGPFRNTGQAGSFFGVHSAIMLALVISNVIPRRVLYLMAAGVSVIALLFTVKRASWIAFLVGLFLLGIFLIFSSSRSGKNNKNIYMVFFSTISLLGFFIFQWAIENVSGLSWRFNTKISSDAAESFSEGFLIENINSSLTALANSPLTGVGLGNVYEIYQKHEIHSTYLGILAYAGLLGTVAYVYFMGTLLMAIWRESIHRIHNIWASFLYAVLPLIIGLLVGWAYTYHIRKREFWILMFFVSVAIELSKRSRRQSSSQY
ncbi:MAG: O-antigen ligase family protein [Fluviibacter phosphoraccumulans]